jgi:uncharacterized lipoprotein YmbA
MMKRWLMVAMVAVVLLAACGGGEPTGRALLEGRCDQCHELELVTGSDKTAEGWTVTVNRMIMHGAELTEAERDILVAYLAEEY